MQESNGANGAGSKGRHVWKQNSVKVNEKKHGIKKSRKDKTKRRPKATKLPPVKEEDRIRGEDVPRKTHSRSKSDGKTKYPSWPRETSSVHNVSPPGGLRLRATIRTAETSAAKKGASRNRTGLSTTTATSSSQAGPVMRVHRRSKSLSRETI